MERPHAIIRSGLNKYSPRRPSFLPAIDCNDLQSKASYYRRPCHFEAGGEKSAPPKARREQILRLRLRMTLLSLHASRNPLKLSSRPERHGDLVPTTNLWRGVEGPRGTIPHHAATGSFSRGIAPVTVALRDMPGLARTDGCTFADKIVLFSIKLLRLPVREERLEAASQRILLRDPSTSRQRFLQGTKFSWRSGRDDRPKRHWRNTAS